MSVAELKTPWLQPVKMTLASGSTPVASSRLRRRPTPARWGRGFGAAALAPLPLLDLVLLGHPAIDTNAARHKVMALTA